MGNDPRTWTVAQLELLKAAWNTPGITREQIGEMTGRGWRPSLYKAQSLGFPTLDVKHDANSFWDAEGRTERLKTFWGEGYTASQVASMIPGSTASSVKSKIKRMGWHRPGGHNLQPKADQARKARATREQNNKSTQAHAVARASLSPELAAVVEGRSADKSVVWLPLPGSTPQEFPARRGHCTWPVETGNGLMACCKVAIGRYCETHDVIAYDRSPQASQRKRNIERVLLMRSRYAA